MRYEFPFIQRLLCDREKGSSSLELHPELIDEGLLYTLDRVATQLIDRGRQYLAIYLEHLTADLRQILSERGKSIARSASKSITTYLPRDKDLPLDIPISIAA